MKFSLSWLSTWSDLTVTLPELLAKLTMAGLEVEGVTPVAKPISGIVVGQVEAVEAHPNADKLRICQVNVGTLVRLTIVCGASNVAVGMKVPTAVIGAKLGDDFEIKAATLRGVASEGMLCSGAELGLAESSHGLLPLPQDAPLGEDIVRYLDLTDNMIELDLTPNRSDCLSIYGLAREVSALYQHALKPLSIPTLTTVSGQAAPKARISATDACSRYLCQLIEGIDNKQESPLWLTEKLRRSGVRSVNPVVDITQYIMLFLGQPLHAFDADKIQGDIDVRYAKAGEELTLLDGKTVKLTPSMLVIADESGAIAVAGVMGGIATAVTVDTKRVLVESAYFEPTAIAGTQRQLGLATDAAHRFERGVDLAQVQPALTLALAELQTLLGGHIQAVQITEVATALPEAHTIVLPMTLIAKVLGFMPDKLWIEASLQRLGLQLSLQQDDVWSWAVPSFRHDLRLPIDLIEEIARLYGYDALPSVPGVHVLQAKVDANLMQQQQWLNYFQVNGFHEAICYSFVSKELDMLIHPGNEPYELTNPLSPELAVMRSSLWGGLLTAAKYNKNRQQTRIRLFEHGRVYQWRDGQLNQPVHIAGIALGPHWPEQWGSVTRNVDFYDMKALLMPLLPDNTEWRPDGHPALHPGRSAGLYLTGQAEPIGYMGELHPKIAHYLDLPAGTYLFELNKQQLPPQVDVVAKALSKFPLNRRDLAFLVSKQHAVGELLAKAMALGGAYVRDLELFDVYQGERIAEDQQSIAMRLTLQADDRTLTDAEMNEIMDKVIYGLGEHYGATLRD